MRATSCGEVRKIAGRAILDYVARANAYISDNLRDTELSVGTIATSVGLSPGYLQQIYRTVTGLTVAQSILDRRLAHCRKELADPSLREESITAILFRWGFSESSSFSRALRRAFGVSPRQYRRLRRAGKITS